LSGSLNSQGSAGNVWSSSVYGLYTGIIYFDSDNTGFLSTLRANGRSVRCIGE